MKAVRKAVIPAAGMGTRFLPATKAQPKEMLPLVDTPAIQYVVEEAIAAGITDILIITGRGKRTLEDHFDRSFELEHHLRQAGRLEDLERVRAIAQMAHIHYVRQGEPRGLGDAVSVAKHHIGDEPFAVMLGDDIMDPRAGVLGDMLEAHDRHSASVLALKEVAREEISSYGAVDAEVVEENLVRVRSLVEKPAPDQAPSNLAVIGRYIFTPAIFDALAEIGPGKGGEIQLTDAISLLTNKEDVMGYVFSTGRYDTGNKLDWLKATVDLALQRPDLGGPFWEYLVEVTRPGRRPNPPTPPSGSGDDMDHGPQ